MDKYISSVCGEVPPDTKKRILDTSEMLNLVNNEECYRCLANQCSESVLSDQFDKELEPPASPKKKSLLTRTTALTEPLDTIAGSRIDHAT